MKGRAEVEAAPLLDPTKSPRVVLALARERMADAAWHRGDAGKALAMYRELLSGPLAEDRARSLDVRVDALAQGGGQADVVFDLLVGRAGRPPPAAVAVHLSRELRSLRDDGLGEYLEARQLMFALDYQRALPLIAQARRRGLATLRLRREALRMEIQLAVGRWQLDRAESLIEEWESSEPQPPELAKIVDWRRRVNWMRAAR